MKAFILKHICKIFDAFYYQFTTFESENIRNYKNIYDYLLKIKMS